jgi:hypothetical protein
MTTSPTFNGAEFGETAPSGGSVTVQYSPGAVETSISFSGSSAAVGSTVTWNYVNSTYSVVYEGYYLNNGVDDPVIQFDSSYYYVLGVTTPGTYAITNAPYTACYAAGSMIATAEGERAVDALAIGDRVVTAAGALRPIRWIGRRAYAGRFLRANPGVQPVRFRAGSLGNGLPRRDLLVSPDHAMFLDGVLVPARCLLNGATITQERQDRIEYVHVELDSHDILLAEGAPSESFVDDGSRACFHNAAEYAALYPDLAPAPVYCARRVEQGPELEAIRRRLRPTADQRAA